MGLGMQTKYYFFHIKRNKFYLNDFYCFIYNYQQLVSLLTFSNQPNAVSILNSNVSPNMFIRNIHVQAMSPSDRRCEK